ncbi:MAG: hypothetical protein A2583_01980 [Bdellovibrionales bacterium RIFOXYD1_FULL_53_11]|nr:MAG: hypothetical protein A2583_01980 [Bdellovibrionales bacterium RIFOXYD1_FULL_53_11]
MPDYARHALKRLDEAGHVAYIVGGSVRDFLLGREYKDHDIATSAEPDELCRLFPDSVTVGRAFGVIKVPLGIAGEAEFLEIATFRKDSDYKDGRHPSKVQFCGPAEDAARRDFTINAFYYDPKTQRILDSVGGMADLRAGIIRAIGEPEKRFREDALRLLRAVRFSAALGFRIDENTAKAISAGARLVSRVSAERIRDELTLMLTGRAPAGACEDLMSLGLMAQVIPETVAMKGIKQSSLYHPEGDVWRHTVKVVDCLAAQNTARSMELSWAALLHDVGKPVAYSRNVGKNFNGHEKDGMKLAGQIADRLRMSREQSTVIAGLVGNHLKFKDVFNMREATLSRFVMQDGFDMLLALHRADAAASDGNMVYHEFCAGRFCEMGTRPSAAEKLVTGEDLLQLGFSPGPVFTDILKWVEDMMLEGKLKTKDQALEQVVKNFVK